MQTSPLLAPPERFTQYAPLIENVRAAERGQTSLFPRGGGTLLDEILPDSAVLDVSSFHDLIDHAHADMTITVQAGMTLSRLGSILASKRQRLALDVPAQERTTVGGVIAANLSGSRRFGCGTPRDLVLGLTVIGANGDIIRPGGRVVKNVAGYDLCKLYTGSRGWLGIIVEATLRVAAQPEAAGAVVIGCKTAEIAESICAQVIRGETRPISIDLLNQAAAREVLGASATLRDLRTPLALLIGFDGVRPAVDWQVARIAELANGTEATLDSGAFAQARQKIVDLAAGVTLAATPHDGITLRASAKSSAAAMLSAEISHICAESPVISHLASGVVSVRMPPSNAARVIEAVRNAGGSWLLPRDSDTRRADMPMCGPPREEWRMMCSVKNTLDPSGIFSFGGAFDRTLRSASAVVL